MSSRQPLSTEDDASLAEGLAQRATTPEATEADCFQQLLATLSGPCGETDMTEDRGI